MQIRSLIPLLLLILVVSVPLLRSQDQKGGVKGFVSDSANGERLSLVNIVIVSKGMGAATDHNGFYFIGNIPAGTVTVRATIIGYRTVERQVRIEAGKIVSANFLLAPNPVMMEGVEQVAERHVRYDTEISTQPIGIREIEIVPTIVEKDLFRTLSVLPGVVATSDVSSQFYVRGGGGDQNLIVLDGMTIYNPFHALGIFSIFDADAIKEAEILKGGFPAQWGNRLSSVINIRTREGNKNRFAGKLNASLVAGKVMLEGPTPWDGSWMIAGRKSFLDDMLQKFVKSETPFDFYDLIARVNHSTGENGRISFHSLLSGDIIRPASAVEPEYLWNNRAYGLTWFQVLENKYLIETTFSMSAFNGELRPRENSSVTARSSEVNDSYFNGGVTYFQQSGDMYGAGFMFRFPEYKYSFTNAANYRREISERNSETGIWFRYKLKQLNPFSIEAGIRSDLFSVLSANSGDAFEPRLSVGYDVSAAHSVKLSYSRVHQRMMTITNEDDVVSLFETWIPISSDMPSQRADHFIFAVDGTAGFVPGLNFNVQAYYKDMANLVEYNRDKVDASDPDFVSADGRSYGLELFIEEKHPVYYGWLSYTLSFTERSVGNFTYSPRYDRRHNLNLLAGVRPGGGWDIGLRWEFGSGLPFTQIMGFYDRLLFGGLFDGTGYGGEKGLPYTILGDKNRGRLPSYHRLDFNVAKTFRFGWVNIIAEGSIINVYNRKNMFYYNQTTGQRIDMLPFLPTVNLKVEF
ncbi:MAG: TonB-dependent receptor [Ignavibacteriae bacterium]|nr:TonB-dependent receptor [Ignavibacteriota bacterium]